MPACRLLQKAECRAAAVAIANYRCIMVQHALSQLFNTNPTMDVKQLQQCSLLPSSPQILSPLTWAHFTAQAWWRMATSPRQWHSS